MTLDKYGRLFEYNREFFDTRQTYDRIDLFQICELMLAAGAEVPAHRQVCHEISYIVSGEGTFYTDGAAIAVRQGDVHVTARGQTHRITAGRARNMRYICVGFEFRGASDGGEDDLPAFYAAPPPRVFQAREDLRYLFGGLVREFFAENPYRDQMIALSVRQILILVARGFRGGSAAPLPMPDGCPRSGATAYGVLQYVDANIRAVKSVREIANALSFTENYLSHMFKAKVGVTLQGYIRAKKAEEAAALLREGKHTVREIAAVLGFDSPQSFARAFKKERGCTPSAYRNTDKDTV
ncbi:MAG: AraC family transcriptional regulator [Clostridiales bacterium]|jgi:AraC-like DNA-binding protein/mannose-6-phosphate isomerase-like protein (cupin superfamily)|nr:AraC family transcriptional regulator [Clostridiales bacterium]